MAIAEGRNVDTLSSLFTTTNQYSITTTADLLMLKGFLFVSDPIYYTALSKLSWVSLSLTQKRLPGLHLTDRPGEGLVGKWLCPGVSLWSPK